MAIAIAAGWTLLDGTIHSRFPARRMHSFECDEPVA
jgi:hypothetical protein